MFATARVVSKTNSRTDGSSPATCDATCGSAVGCTCTTARAGRAPRRPGRSSGRPGRRRRGWRAARSRRRRACRTRRRSRKRALDVGQRKCRQQPEPVGSTGDAVRAELVERTRHPPADGGIAELQRHRHREQRGRDLVPVHHGERVLEGPRRQRRAVDLVDAHPGQLLDQPRGDVVVVHVDAIRGHAASLGRRPAAASSTTRPATAHAPSTATRPQIAAPSK